MTSTQKPISIGDFRAALPDLPDDALLGLEQQLKLSLEKLRETNDTLEKEISEIKQTQENITEASQREELKNDTIIYQEAVQENRVVIENQQQRLELVEETLRKRGLKASSTTQNEDNKGIYI